MSWTFKGDPRVENSALAAAVADRSDLSEPEAASEVVPSTVFPLINDYECADVGPVVADVRN